MTIVDTNFGKVVKVYRDKLKISQEALAYKAQLHRTYISQIERGKKSPTLKVMMILAAALEVPLSTLIIETEKYLEFDNNYD